MAFIGTLIVVPKDILRTARDCAVDYGWKEIYFNAESAVVSFALNSQRIRMNVYFTTRTVATCLDHPFHGKTQLFRRAVSDEELEALFRNPRSHTGKGFYKVPLIPALEEEDALREEIAQVARKKLELEAMLKRREDANRAKREREERERIEREKRERIEREEREKREKRERNALEARLGEEQAKLSKRATRSIRGQVTHRLFHPNIHTQLCEILDNLGATAVEIAVGEHCFLSCDEDGSWACGGRLPQKLFHILRNRGHNLTNPHTRLNYAALGSFDRYYVRFDDDTERFFIPEGLAVEIARASTKIEFVAFGSEFESYIAKFKDGSFVWNGVPTRLANLINGRMNSKKFGKLVAVALDPVDPLCFFARWLNGDVQFLLPPDIAENANKLGHQIRTVALGAHGYFVIRGVQ